VQWFQDPVLFLLLPEQHTDEKYHQSVDHRHLLTMHLHR
jgi:hypothetical protein